MTSQPMIITKPAFTAVGLLLHTKPMSPDIPELWDRFVPRMNEIPHQCEPYVSYGLMTDTNPTTGSMDYLAGNAVSHIDQFPSGMTRWDIPANTYAVLETTLSGIGTAFDAIYNTWLPSSEYQAVDAPFFERYGEAFSPENPVVEIYIPIKKNEPKGADNE